MDLREWAQRGKSFTPHVKAHQRTSATEKTLNDQLDKLTADWCRLALFVCLSCNDIVAKDTKATAAEKVAVCGNSRGFHLARLIQLQLTASE